MRRAAEGVFRGAPLGRRVPVAYSEYGQSGPLRQRTVCRIIPKGLDAVHKRLTEMATVPCEGSARSVPPAWPEYRTECRTSTERPVGVLQASYYLRRCLSHALDKPN